MEENLKGKLKKEQWRDRDQKGWRWYSELTMRDRLINEEEAIKFLREIKRKRISASEKSGQEAIVGKNAGA